MKCRFHVLLAALLLPVSLAAERTERTFPASDDTLVEVRNQTGRVLVRGWDRPQVQVVAQRRSRAAEVHFEQVASRLHVHTHILQADIQASDRAIDYEIWMPANAQLELHTDAGQVEIEGLRDVVKIETVAAGVELRDVSGTVEVTTTSGPVRIASCSGRARMNSVSGDLTLVDSPLRSLSARTASGNIRYEGALLGGGSYEFSNHQGVIELRLPADASFELTARAVQGEVVNTFPLTPKTHGRVPVAGYARSLLGTVQSGAALVRATTFSGKITIGKR